MRRVRCAQRKEDVVTDDEKASLWAYEELARRASFGPSIAEAWYKNGDIVTNLAASLIAKHEQPPEPEVDEATRVWADAYLAWDNASPGIFMAGDDAAIAVIREALARKDAEKAEAVAAERERCAKVAGTWHSSLRPGSGDRLSGHVEAARDIAAAIRNGGTGD